MYKSKLDFSPGLTYFRMAQIHAFQNNKKKALQYIDELRKTRAIYFIELMTGDPMFESLWSDPDFLEIIAEVNDIKASISIQISELEEEGELDFW